MNVSDSYELTRRDVRTSSWLEVATVDDDETASQQRGEEGQTVRQVSRCSAVQSSVYKVRQFEIDALRSTKSVKTGKSVSDVI